MANNRAGRINKAVAHELGDILRDVKDPRIAENYVTINSAEVTGDLKNAKIFYGCIAGDPKAVRKGLESAKGFLRRELAERLNLRQTPELTFIFDDGAAHGAHIAEVLKELKLSSDRNAEFSGVQENAEAADENEATYRSDREDEAEDAQ